MIPRSPVPPPLAGGSSSSPLRRGSFTISGAHPPLGLRHPRPCPRAQRAAPPPPELVGREGVGQPRTRCRGGARSCTSPSNPRRHLLRAHHRRAPLRVVSALRPASGSAAARPRRRAYSLPLASSSRCPAKATTRRWPAVVGVVAGGRGPIHRLAGLLMSVVLSVNKGQCGHFTCSIKRGGRRWTAT
jgi:hypothetical protein